MPCEILKRYAIALGMLISLGVRAFGQGYPVKHFTVEDGLPSNTVYNVYCDSKGFLWISTDKGVARYNGQKFEKFTTLNGLADNEVFFAREDSYHRLWFATFNGKLCYYKDDTFHNATNTPWLKQKDRHSQTSRIFLEKDGSVSIGFLDVGYFCNITRDKCTDVQFADKKKDFAYHSLFHVQKLDSLSYRVVTNHDVLTLDLTSGPRIVNSQPCPLKGTFFSSTQGQGQPWFFYFDSAAYSSDFKTQWKYPGGLLFSSTALRPRYVDDNSNVLWPTNHGIYINDSIRFLERENISSVTQDPRKNYWITTLGNGLFCLNKHFIDSRLYTSAYNGRILYSKEVDNKLFYFTDEHELFFFENGKSKSLFRNHDFNPKQEVFGSSAFLLDSDLTFYYFFGLKNFVYTDVLNTPTKVKKYRYSFLNCRHSLKEVIRSGKELYVNTGYGIRSIDLEHYAEGDSVKCIRLPDARGERMFAMAKAEDGVVWYSTIDSLYSTIGETGSQLNRQYRNLSFKDFDFLGKFLVGVTHDNRLQIYDCRKGDIKKYEVASECIWDKLYPLDSTHALISTNGLYYVLSLNAGASLPYNVSAVENSFIPLQPDAICVGAANCYFFKGGDITSIKKVELLDGMKPPQLYFTGLRASKSLFRINGPIELAHGEAGNISISFSSLAFGGKDPTYQYSISKNETDNWVNVKGDINLADLPFGTYTLKIRGKTISSVFSEPITLTLTILRPFWATWWFISILVAMLGVCIWLIVRRRVRATMLRKEKEHENHVRFIRSEYKAMNALMNPHFVFNSINNVQSLVNNHDVMNATEYLGIFAELLRQNMHNISNDTIPLQKEIELVENYLLLEKLRFEDQLSYSINIADNMFMSDIMVPPLLLQPLVENSIKHGILPLKSRGKQGHVYINIYEQDDALFIEVKDNGIGIAKAQEKRSLHQSYGLNNIKNRIEQLSIIQGKEISFQLSEVNSEEGASEGTLAVIKMPLS